MYTLRLLVIFAVIQPTHNSYAMQTVLSKQEHEKKLEHYFSDNDMKKSLVIGCGHDTEKHIIMGGGLSTGEHTHASALTVDSSKKRHPDLVINWTKSADRAIPPRFKFDLIHYENPEEVYASLQGYINLLSHLKAEGKIIFDGLGQIASGPTGEYLFYADLLLIHGRPGERPMLDLITPPEVNKWDSLNTCNNGQPYTWESKTLPFSTNERFAEDQKDAFKVMSCFLSLIGFENIDVENPAIHPMNNREGEIILTATLQNNQDRTDHIIETIKKYIERAKNGEELNFVTFMRDEAKTYENKLKQKKEAQESFLAITKLCLETLERGGNALSFRNSVKDYSSFPELGEFKQYCTALIARIAVFKKQKTDFQGAKGMLEGPRQQVIKVLTELQSFAEKHSFPIDDVLSYLKNEGII